MSKHIGFISTRFAGTDGVTLEASKWANVLQNSGHKSFWFAGDLDRNPKYSMHVPEAFFHHEHNNWINKRILGKKGRSPKVTATIHNLRAELKKHLHSFINRFSIDFIIVENALTIPMHIPLGLALAEFIAETQIPTIAHHHDFYWERTRFFVTAVDDYIRMAFPPNLPNIEHIVINSKAREELALRTGLSSIVIPNVLDFENPPEIDMEMTEKIRKSINLSREDLVFLQPTRIVQRKGIEHAIELVQALDNPRCKLIISHEAGDEGYEYETWLKANATRHNVDLKMITSKIADPFHLEGNNGADYTLWDIYPHADFITYPSLYEGFGNAFLEAIYFKKPILINRYANFVRDIEPLKFDLIAMDGFLTQNCIKRVQKVLESSTRREKMVDHNYRVAKEKYSYSVLHRKLRSVLRNSFGVEI